MVDELLIQLWKLLLANMQTPQINISKSAWVETFRFSQFAQINHITTRNDRYATICHQ